MARPPESVRSSGPKHLFEGGYLSEDLLLFSSKRGMGCTNHQQRTAIAGETLDDQGQDLNHSAKDIHADGSGADFAQALNAKRGKLNLLPAGAKEQWEKQKGIQES